MIWSSFIREFKSLLGLLDQLDSVLGSITFLGVRPFIFLCSYSPKFSNMLGVVDFSVLFLDYPAPNRPHQHHWVGNLL